MEAGAVAKNDGVGLVCRGDLLLIVYQAAARLHRTQWLFDRMDELIEKTPSGILVFMIVLPTSEPPDGPTRAENNARLKKAGSKMRRLVTTPVGDALWFAIVRTIMRGMSILQGNSKVHFVSETISDGIKRTLEASTAKTPSRSQIIEDIQALHRALGVPTPPLT